MAKKIVPAAPEHPELPGWFDAETHRREPRGIVLAATGDLLGEDGLPVNGAARAIVCSGMDINGVPAARWINGQPVPIEAPAQAQE